MERNCEACKYYVTSEDGKTKGCSRWECKYDERMTNEEAIRVLENYKPKVKRATLAAKRAKEAFDMAISALKENKGEWINETPCEDVCSIYTCSECGMSNLWESPFCPSCGADMRGE